MLSKQLQTILDLCTADQQNTLIKLREIILEHKNIREFSETRHIKYGSIKKQPLAEIVWKNNENWKNPELILKLPRITGHRKIVKQQSKKYGIKINTDGNPDNLVNIYLIKRLTCKSTIKLKGKFGLLQMLSIDESIEPNMIYQKLINLALQKTII